MPLTDEDIRNLAEALEKHYKNLVVLESRLGDRFEALRTRAAPEEDDLFWAAYRAYKRAGGHASFARSAIADAIRALNPAWRVEEANLEAYLVLHPEDRGTQIGPPPRRKP